MNHLRRCKLSEMVVSQSHVCRDSNDQVQMSTTPLTKPHDLVSSELCPSSKGTAETCHIISTNRRWD